jgi:hypothetical protein
MCRGREIDGQPNGHEKDSDKIANVDVPCQWNRDAEFGCCTVPCTCAVVGEIGRFVFTIIFGAMYYNLF